MSFPTIEGSAILSLCLDMPIGATWLAKIDSDAEQLSGTVVIDDGAGQQFTGRVRRSGVVVGRNRALVVGGKGKLADGDFTLASRHFRAVDLRTVANEILDQSGETLAASSQAAVLAASLPFWTVAADGPGAALTALLEPQGATWRTLADGTVWIGVDTFPEAPKQDRLEIEPYHQDALVCLAVDAFALRPGVTLDGRKVVHVEHRFGDEGRRTDYWYG